MHSLGALMYLVDAGLNKQVECIASVSGGSVANGSVAQNCHYRHVTSEDFERIVGEISRGIVHRGLIPSTPFYLYISVVLTLGAIATTAIVAPLLHSWPWRSPSPGMTAAILLAALFAVWSLRGHVLTYLLRHRIFSGRSITFGELDKLTLQFAIRAGTQAGQSVIGNLDIEHVFCATDLNHGVPVFLSTYGGGKIYSDAHGWGRAGHVSLSDAVRSSAAFPGGFPPRRLATRKCDFGGPAIGWSGVIQRRCNTTAGSVSC